MNMTRLWLFLLQKSPWNLWRMRSCDVLRVQSRSDPGCWHRSGTSDGSLETLHYGKPGGHTCIFSDKPRDTDTRGFQRHKYYHQPKPACSYKISAHGLTCSISVLKLKNQISDKECQGTLLNDSEKHQWFFHMTIIIICLRMWACAVSNQVNFL